MGGLIGFIDFSGLRGKDELEHIVRVMAAGPPHDGLSDPGVWTDEPHGAALAYRWLASCDSALAGCCQPVHTHDGRFTIACDGEIYNAEELRGGLTDRYGAIFAGASDAETLLYGCALEGVESFVKKCNGMFSFAFFDSAETRLFLVRDRMGIKPLYYAHCGNCFLFASELKSLTRHPAWQGDINRDAITQVMRFGYILAPNSIYVHSRKLEPGRILTLDAHGNSRETAYWNIREKIPEWQQTSLPDIPDTVEYVHELLKDAVNRRFTADAPPGAFLSGGIDSSLVTALMQARTLKKIRTFSIGFAETEYDESSYAQAVAAHLGTNHTELRMTTDDALRCVPLLPSLYDEPFADSSQLPTFLLASLTQRHTGAILSGDGGDELFVGYDRYFEHITEKIPLPPFFWRTVASFVRHAPAAVWNAVGKTAPKRYRKDFREKLLSLLDRNAFYGAQRYKHCISNWRQPECLVREAHEPVHPCDDPVFWEVVQGKIAKMQAVDCLSYLPDDCLVKVDRVGRAVSLEVRAPLLDHRVVGTAWRLPHAQKVRDNTSKWILRELLRRYVPDRLFERPKMGFGAPIDRWLRGALRDWAEDLLDTDRMEREGFLDPGPVRDVWQRHLRGENHCYRLWNVLMFQAWLRESTRP